MTKDYTVVKITMKGLLAENTKLKEDMKEMARLLGCLDPDEYGLSTDGCNCLACKALKEKP